MLSRHQVPISSPVVASQPGASFTNATGTSPRSRSARPTTALPAIAG